MKRRSLLSGAAATGGALLAGCLDGPDGSADADPGTDDGTDAGTASGTDDGSGEGPDSETDPGTDDGEDAESEGSADGECGPAAKPLSERLSDERGDPDACFDGAKPDLAVENERETAVTATVSLASTGESATTEATFDLALEPGERAVETAAFEAAPDLEATVSVDGDAHEARWTERSCYRHGIAITPDGVATGRIEPLQGPGDTQHDCYPGHDVPLEVGVVDDRPEPETVSVTVDDRCAGTTDHETVEIDPGEHGRLDGWLESGGTYDVTVAVEGGDESTLAFHEGCWGVSAHVQPDGTVRLHEMGID